MCRRSTISFWKLALPSCLLVLQNEDWLWCKLKPDGPNRPSLCHGSPATERLAGPFASHPCPSDPLLSPARCPSPSPWPPPKSLSSHAIHSTSAPFVPCISTMHFYCRNKPSDSPHAAWEMLHSTARKIWKGFSAVLSTDDPLLLLFSNKLREKEGRRCCLMIHPGFRIVSWYLIGTKDLCVPRNPDKDLMLGFVDRTVKTFGSNRATNSKVRVSGESGAFDSDSPP